MTFRCAPEVANEAHRLAILNGLRILDSLPEPEFDNIVDLAAAFFGVRYCLISLVDADRQWFKASFGLDVSETPRAPSFCGHAIAQNDIFVVPDAASDSHFAGNPLVTGAPYVRFYAGAPLIFDGQAVGTLCVIDDIPRTGFSTKERAQLRQFGAIIEEMIEHRLRRISG